MLLAQFIRGGSQSLEALYPPQEARSLILRLCEDILGVSSYTHIVEPQTEIPSAALPGLQAALSRLQAGEPLQYVLGRADFCGRSFKVGPGVLIPRPETEQLAQAAVSYALTLGRPASALDLCTGSGCIAWTLALDVPGSSVTATDISADALRIASSQFEGHGPVFLLSDVLSDGEEIAGGPFDVVVSNPPYVMESERSLMRRNVLEHEPGLALFVPDDYPLLFYRAVARKCRRLLRPGGFGMVEINEVHGDATEAALIAEGLVETKQIKDFFGKTRFISFTNSMLSDI